MYIADIPNNYIKRLETFENTMNFITGIKKYAGEYFKEITENQLRTKVLSEMFQNNLDTADFDIYLNKSKEILKSKHIIELECEYIKLLPKRIIQHE